MPVPLMGFFPPEPCSPRAAVRRLRRRSPLVVCDTQPFPFSRQKSVRRNAPHSTPVSAPHHPKAVRRVPDCPARRHCSQPDAKPEGSPPRPAGTPKPPTEVHRFSTDRREATCFSPTEPGPSAEADDPVLQTPAKLPKQLTLRRQGMAFCRNSPRPPCHAVLPRAEARDRTSPDFPQPDEVILRAAVRRVPCPAVPERPPKRSSRPNSAASYPEFLPKQAPQWLADPPKDRAPKNPSVDRPRWPMHRAVADPAKREPLRPTTPKRPGTQDPILLWLPKQPPEVRVTRAAVPKHDLPSRPRKTQTSTPDFRVFLHTRIRFPAPAV
jgi:hypothetical protein